MATLVYTQCPLVAAGYPMSAAHMAAIAAATNSRVLGGAGDCDWRIAYYLFSGLFRQIRNPDELGNFPAEAEYFAIYQALNANDASWPLSGPGDPEGVNVSNILGAFVFGSDALDLASERQRLAGVTVGNAATPSDAWLLMKQQAGAYDPSTGAFAAPMLDLGTSYLDIRTASYSPHGNSWGGYQPGPLKDSACDLIGDLRPPNLHIFFTRIEDGYVLEFDGTCPEQATHIAHIAYRPLTYIVILNNGATYYLPKAQWIEGPYTNDARLRKQSANALSRVVTQFAAEFRGTEAQRAGDDQGIEDAFQLEDDFLSRQYPLAPAVGQDLGEIIVSKYPRWKALGSAALLHGADTALPGDDGEAWGCPEGSIIERLHVVGSGLRRGFSLTLRDGGEDIATQAVEVAEGECDLIWVLAAPRRFTELRVVVAESIAFTAAEGEVEVEAMCQLEYRPGKDDYYAVTRLANYNGQFASLDGTGITCDAARAISDGLRDNGCVVPLSDGSDSAPAGFTPPINQNAVFDAARRLSKCVRILPRAQLVKYAVTGGKSVLWFRRYAYGLSHDTPADLLDGIGPAKDAIANGGIEWGVRYRVESGVVFYPPNGPRYAAGDTFAGQQDLGTWTGEGEVREADGIRATAPPRGWSRRWALNLTLKPYHPSESSIWKPSAFADVNTPFFQRCAFDSTGIAYSSEPLLHFTFGVRPAYIPEMPSGYNYAPTPDNPFHVNRVNEPLCSEEDEDCNDRRERLYQSCRIYEPPLEIESAVRDANGGEELVKVTLTGRLHHHHSLAPSSVDADYTTWTAADVRAEAESYRTLENGLREYLLNQFVGYNADASGPGNNAWGSTIQSDPDNPFGSCYPTFILTQLIPEPYLDGNDDEDDSDSPKLSDTLRLVELYLRAMCEGFVDGRTTAANACAASTTTLYDYTFPNLLFDAIGNRWVPLLPESIRPDNPEGHGPMPITSPHADIFNALAQSVNKLTTVRVMLPATLQFRSITDTYSVDVTDRVRNSDGDLATVGGFSNSPADFAVWLTTGARGGTLSTSTGSWSDDTAGSASVAVNLFASSSSATLQTVRVRTEWRWDHRDGSEYALPPTISGLLASSPGIAVSILSGSVGQRRTVVSGESNGSQCVGSGEGPTSITWRNSSGGASLFTEISRDGGTACSYQRGGTLSASDPPGGDVAASDSWPDDVSGNSCGWGLLSYQNLEAFNTSTPAMVIPTADYAGGS